jgi:hypothetical protein
MVTMRNMRVYRAEFSHPEIDGFRSVVVFDIFGEREFGHSRPNHTAAPSVGSQVRSMQPVFRNPLMKACPSKRHFFAFGDRGSWSLRAGPAAKIPFPAAG